MDITISRAKSQFYYSGIKIVSYICDFEGWYLNTSKVLKIFNKLKYINIITTQAFIGIYIYYWIWIKDFA